MKNNSRSWLVLCAALLLLLALPLHGQTKQKADLLVTGGTVVTMDGTRSIYDNGAVAVTGDTASSTSIHAAAVLIILTGYAARRQQNERQRVDRV